MKKLLALILTLALLTSSALALDLSFFSRKEVAEEPAAEPAEAAAAYAKFEGPGYASPEEAALAYAEALKNQDAMAAISTFAIESYVDNVDFDVRVGRYRMFAIQSYAGMIPAQNAYFRQIQVFQRFAAISDYMQYAYMNGIWDEEELGKGFMEPFFFDDSMIPTLLRESLARGEDELGFDKIEVLGTVSLLAINRDRAETYYGERSQENIANLCKDYGGDEITDVAVELRINGVDYIQFMQCIRYGDKWYNLHALSSFASYLGLDAMTGALVPKDTVCE